MRRITALLVFLLMVGSISSSSMTLKEAYETAGPGNGYDKYVELETGVIYTGGLLIGPVFSPFTWVLEGDPGLEVCIVGNGAILDLQGQQLCLSYCDNRLDISDCIILNGNIRYRGMSTDQYHVLPVGSVEHVTFYNPDDYGIRLQGAGTGIRIERNLVVNAVDTGPDFVYMNGLHEGWLPTGTNISFSVQGIYGTPIIRENWSYHTDPVANAEMLRHFSLLCEYG